jgi:hypothetical protein
VGIIRKLALVQGIGDKSLFKVLDIGGSTGDFCFSAIADKIWNGDRGNNTDPIIAITIISSIRVKPWLAVSSLLSVLWIALLNLKYGLFICFPNTMGSFDFPER